MNLTKKPNILTMGLMAAVAAQAATQQHEAPSPVPATRETPEDVYKRIGARPMDQVFINTNHGSFNASKMLRMVMSKPKNFALLRLPITQGLIDYIMGFVELDQGLLEDMTDARRDEPILGVELRDANPLLIIDGHHRIIKRWQQGLRDVSILIMPNNKVHMIHAPHDKKTS